MKRVFTPARLLTLGMAAALLLTGVAWADSPYAIRDPKVPKNLSPAARARLQRTTALKRKQEAKKFVLETVQKDQDAASDHSKKGSPHEKTR